MAEPLDWARDGPHWPHHDASRFVAAGGVRWHLQRAGPGRDSAAPAVLLLHGTGASAHSWRALLPLLARRFDVLVPDLPGHGFSSSPLASSAFTLPGMAAALAELLRAEGVAPRLVVGHSAGAAIGAQLLLAGYLQADALVAVNGAMVPLHGLAWQWFSPLAKLLALNPLVPRLFAWRAADPAAVRRLIDGTGSKLDDEGVALYARLVADPRHVAGALRMMANWDLHALSAQLPRLPAPLQLLVGTADRTLPPHHGEHVRDHVPGASLVELPGLGHLAHEEAPARVAALLGSHLDRFVNAA